MLLVNGNDAIYVDITLCTGWSDSKDWLVEKCSVVSVIGYVEYRHSQVRVRSFHVPRWVGLRLITGQKNVSLDVPKHMQNPVTIIQDVQVQALMIIPSGDVDVRAWNETVAHMEQLGRTINKG